MGNPVYKMQIEGVDVRKVKKFRNSRILARLERRDVACINGHATGESHRAIERQKMRRLARRMKGR